MLFAVPAQAQTTSFGTNTIPDQTFGLPGTGCSDTYPARVSLTLPEATGTGTITYTLIGQPSSLTFTASSRALSGTLAADLKQASAVSHTLTYTATSSGGTSDLLTFTIAIVDERPPLEALYTSTNGANWATSTNWAADIPAATCLEDLHGVTLDNGTGRVTKIDLNDNRLSGSIPSELSSLTGLTELWLRSNRLSGSIPSELGSITGLTQLWLDVNQLSGSIPSELGNLASLKNLVLYSNDLSGSIPSELGNLASLMVLNLYNNDLSGSIPAELGRLTSLTELYLYSNDLSGSIPAELGNLGSLTLLWLYGNDLSGSIPAELGNLGSLTQLRLQSNQLSGSIPAALGRLSSLTQLFLYQNQLSGSIPAELGNLGSLTHLRLERNQLSGSIPAELGSLGSLTWLILHQNQLSGPIPMELGSLSSLMILNLSQNQLSGSIPAELGSLSSLTQLHLYRNQLSGSIPAELGSLSSLTWLWLYENQLSGSIPAELGSLTSLTHFRLYSNELSGSIPTELGSLTGLTTLYLDGNELSGSIPTELGSLTSLTDLRLYDNQLSGSIPTELGSLTSLRILWLHDNQLSGSIPTELGSLTSLTNIYLHNNQLSGEIPALNNSNLSHLYLHNNRLTGAVPEFTSATGHFRLSLFGNAGLYGYPAALNNRSSLRLLAPGDSSAVCLPSTQGGTDCVVPTKVDNLLVQASGQQLVFSWKPRPANPAPSGYNAWYFPAPSGPWTSATVNGTTTRTPAEIASFLVRTQDAPNSPRLYYVHGLLPLSPFTLSVDATPPCGSEVTDTSVGPTYSLVLTPASNTDVLTERRVVADYYQNWLSAIPIAAGAGRSVRSSHSFPSLRNAYPGFRGFEFRLTDAPGVTAQCFWTFTEDPAPPQTPPNTGGPGTGGGGGGGSGPPAQSSDASLDTLEVGEDSLDPDPDTDTYTLDAYGETSLTLSPAASDRGARITVNGERVRSGTPYTVTLEDDGETVIEIVVTAEDGTTRRTYTLTVMSCHVEERKILEMFYDSTQGDMWEQSGGWNTEDDLRDWHGVDTDEDGNVISLRLPGNGLSGVIPSALQCFSELKELALWDNDDLLGEVPDELMRAVERTALKDVAVALSLNPAWFDDYEDPFNFEDWHSGVTTDDDGRVTELDFTGEDIEGEIPGRVFEELRRLRVIKTGCGVTLEVEAPERVSVTMPDDCPEETAPEDMEEEETAASGDGGCAVGQGDSSLSALFLLTLLVFAALGRRRARG